MQKKRERKPPNNTIQVSEYFRAKERKRKILRVGYTSRSATGWHKLAKPQRNRSRHMLGEEQAVAK